MLSILKRLVKKPFTPLNLITISRQRLVDNYHALSKINPEVKVAPVLKSNAYGHGIRLVGEILDEVKAPFLCVDSLYEAFQVQSKARAKTPVLIMGYIHPKSLEVKKLPFSFAVYDLAHAQNLNKFQQGAKIHIFIDTGMNREGVSMGYLDHFLTELKKLENIEVEGVMSHLAEPANPGSDLTKTQLANFQKAKKAVLDAGYKPKWFHVGGTYGLLNELTAGCNLVRVGRAVFGIDDKQSLRSDDLKQSLRFSASPAILKQSLRLRLKDSKALDLKLLPVLKHTTKIVQIKNINKGDKVGYSGTYTAPKDMKIGILPLGYNDGVDRRLSNKGVVMVDGKECPIIGLVSMNITTIDLSAVSEPFLAQEAVVFSDNAQDPNSVVNASKKGGILPHEMLIHIAESTKRIVV